MFTIEIQRGHGTDITSFRSRCFDSFLKKSGGAFGRSVSYRRTERKLAMNSYFYGRKEVDKNMDFSPSLQTISFDDIKMAIKQLSTTYYDNRAEYVKGVAVNELPTNIKSILSKYVYYNEL